jgi:hypothetical protein
VSKQVKHDGTAIVLIALLQLLFFECQMQSGFFICILSPLRKTKDSGVLKLSLEEFIIISELLTPRKIY